MLLSQVSLFLESYIFLSLSTIELSMLASEQESSYQDQLQKKACYREMEIEDARRVAAYSNGIKAGTANQELETKALGFESPKAYTEFLFNQRIAAFNAETQRIISPSKPLVTSSSFSYTPPVDRQLIKLENAIKLDEERELQFAKHLRTTIFNELRKRNSTKPMNVDQKDIFMKHCKEIARQTWVDYIL